MTKGDFDRWLDIQVERYPAVLRRRVAACLEDVMRLSVELSLSQDISTLMKRFRSFNGEIVATEAPLPVALWIALDRLDRAYFDIHNFNPSDYLCEPVIQAAYGLDLEVGRAAPGPTPSRPAVARKETKRKMSIYVVRKLEAAEAPFGDRSRKEIDQICAAYVARRASSGSASSLTLASRLVEGSEWRADGITEIDVVRYMEARELAWTEAHSPRELLSAPVDAAANAVRPKKAADGLPPKKWLSIWQSLVERGYLNAPRGDKKKIFSDVKESHVGISDRTLKRVIAAGLNGELDPPAGKAPR